MNKFVNRTSELAFLNDQYKNQSAALVVIYGRRRVGKTALIRNFIKDKPFVYFLATEESEQRNMANLQEQIVDFTGDELLAQVQVETWDVLFRTFINHEADTKKVLVIDEFQYLSKGNAGFPSVFQRIWDMYLANSDVMVILCGSLVNMMESQTLAYSSPLYGRRTGQIKLRQISFANYSEFFPEFNERQLIEFYAVTGGVPKYIQALSGSTEIFSAIEEKIINRQSFLFEEPKFLLQNEVNEVGSYFSIIRSIAAGNHKLAKISAELGTKQTSLSKYLKILMDLDIIMREVPVTENNPEKSKMGLYRLKDNFMDFWFKFIYPERSRLELEQSEIVMERIKREFASKHVAFIYEDVCQTYMWELNQAGILNFDKLGRWWDKNTEIDIVALDTSGDEIVFAECKYTNSPMDTDVFYSLIEKAKKVPYKNGQRKERYVLFAINGYTQYLEAEAMRRDDLILYKR